MNRAATRRGRWRVVAVLVATLSLGGVIFAGVGVGGSQARTAAPWTAVPAKVGSFLLVQGRITVEQANGAKPVRVRNGTPLGRGDLVIMDAKGASARIVFTAQAKRGSGLLFSVVGLHALVHQFAPEVADLGPRVAISYDGKSIATVAGKGLDAPVQIGAVKPHGAGKLAVSFGARGTQRPTFACRVDASAFRTCTSPILLARGARLSVETTSLFGFHGPAVSRVVR